jgi:DNA ligase (NAD+)
MNCISDTTIYINSSNSDSDMSFKISKSELSINPEQYGNNLPINVLEKLIEKANEHYELKEPIISDYIYDILFDILIKRNPTNKLIQNIGFKSDTEKVKLPYHMGSMTKLKNIDKIKNWLKKYSGQEYIISGKLDGASALLEKKDNIYKLYSRGNGTYGRDISHIIPFLIKHKKIPNISTINYNYCVRGELIVSKENFKDYINDYTNSRSMVNGLIGAKEIKKGIKALDFVVFELLHFNHSNQFNDKSTIMNSYQQLTLCSKLGFNICHFEKYNLSNVSNFGLENKIESSFLLKTLLEFRLNSNYDIDGIIVTDNNCHIRNTAGNPEYSIAFKSNGIGKITKVKNVEWNISKHGYLIPRICIQPINIDGVNINYATGFNAKFIVDNNIGLESELRIVRSGDVIPFVIEIITKSKIPIMPKIDYKWNDTLVNILIKDQTSSQLHYKKILHFFRTLGIENISEGLIHRFIEYGFDTIKKILLITKDELLSLDGIQQTMANKLYINIHNVIDVPISLDKLMSASLVFGHGFGLKKFKAIITKIPNIIELSYVSSEIIESINGFSTKTANKFVTHLDNFKLFMKNLDFLKIEIPKKIDIEKKTKYTLLLNQTIVLTGFRDEKIMDFIINNGGVISNTINKKINLLITKDTNYHNSKVDAAHIIGIPIITKNKFIEKYKL